MARPLTVRPPTAQQLRRIHRCLETPLQPWQRRRAEALLLLAAGHTAAFIAGLLGVHVKTIYDADLHAFARSGLRCLQPTRRAGARPRLTKAQLKAIWRLAEQSPLSKGLPFARWSLAKLRAYLIRERLVRAISRAHLRRILKKGGSVCVGCVANS